VKHNLKKFTEPKVQRLLEVLTTADWARKEAYADYLAQTHYYINYTTRILAASAARMPLERQDLHVQYMRHAAEEKGHESLSVRDLEALGFKLSDFSELPATKNLYRSIFFLIEHVNPLCLIGYAYFLESIAVVAGVPLVAKLEKLYGKKCVRHFGVHATEDPEHVAALEKLFDSFTETELKHIEEAVTMTATEYESMVDQAQIRSGAGQKKKVA
jgi:hypothetical protein